MQEGFGTRNSAEFWTVKSGYFAKRVSEGTEGSFPVKKQNGEIYHEVRQDYFTGRLKKVDVKTHEEYGDFLKLTMIAHGKSYILEMDLNSGYAFGFLSTIPNAELSELMQLSPSYTDTDGKKQSKMFIQQSSGWLKQYFTKDNPNGLPDLQKIKVKGKETWDNTERLEWLKSNLIPKLNGKLAQLFTQEEPAEDVTETASETTKPPF
jgi:hypothetical protein